MSRKPVKELTDEDRVLWNLVARSTTPLKEVQKLRRAKAARMKELNVAEVLEEPIISMAQALAETLAEPAKPAAPAPKKPSTGQHPIDRPTHDKLAGGRLPIEGRVDLHGMTQEQAYSLLLSFLGRAHANGVRYVLVITGKGSSSGGDGVLKRAVPGWLATAPFRGLVSSHDHAARHHGGAGALYVRLRRRTPRA
jgi:DNA-nicking Smr family endonuclease